MAKTTYMKMSRQCRQYVYVMQFYAMKCHLRLDLIHYKRWFKIIYVRRKAFQ